MSEPNDDQKKDDTKSSSIWPPIFFVCGIVVILFIAQQFEDSSGSGGKFLGWFLGIGALLIFLNIIWGSSLRETMSNLKGVTKAILGFLLVVFIIGGIGQCTGGSDGVGDGLGGVPDNWRK